MDKALASRRQFLLGTLSGASSLWLGTHWPAILAAQQHVHRATASGEPGKLEFFSAEQAAEIEAMAAQIIPTDDTPGAREARVIYFIDRALTTFAREQQPLYLQGLKELRAKVSELFPGATQFSRLSAQQQIQLLTAMEKTEFFSFVRLHTIAGFLCDPRHGGNHDQIGWKLIGFTDGYAYQPPFGYYDSEAEKNNE